VKDPTYKRCRCRDENGRELGASCPKLHRADGSWNPRHGEWYFALELPPGPDGKRRPRLRRRGGDSQADALAAWESARDKLRKGADPAVRTTTSRFLLEWIAGRPDLKGTTRRNYTLIIGTYLAPLLGHIELDRLRAGHISEMFATIESWNAELAAGRPLRKYQRHVGPASMQRIRACLRAALNDAVGQGLIGFNPATRVRMASEKKRRPVVWTDERAEEFWAGFRSRVAAAMGAAGGQRVDQLAIWRDMRMRPAPVMVWTPRDTGAFLDHAAGHRLSALFELAVSTGARRGEICGLRWTDVDLQARTITIATQRVMVGWQATDDEPKSEMSKRIVALDEATAAALRAHRKQQLADRLAWMDAWTESGKVFVREDGGALHPAAVTLLFNRLAFGAGLPPVRFHDLRHGAATYALAAGVDVKVVQERLGHSTSALTRDVYTSVLPEVARAAAETVAAMIPRRVTQ
jgi:integrase